MQMSILSTHVASMPTRRQQAEVRRVRRFRMSNLAIRTMTLRDVPQLNGLDKADLYGGRYWLESIPSRDLPEVRTESDEPIPVPDWQNEDLLLRYELWAQNHRDHPLLIGAFDRKRLVGFSLVTGLAPGREAEVHLLYVEVGFRRYGIGSALLAGLRRRARSARCVSLGHYSSFDSRWMAFYLRHGFSIVSDVGSPAVRHRLHPNDVRLTRPL
jgi:GNAT superfamily N-acetyltransferase